MAFSHSPMKRKDDAHSSRKSKKVNEYFIIFNFFEHIQPPPMFSTFKAGFSHVMKTVVQHSQFVEGMILRDVTAKGKFPYLSFCVFYLDSGTFQHDPRWIRAILEGHGNLQVHHQAGFSELYTFGPPPLTRTPKGLNGNETNAFIAIVFKAEGNFERLDETWQKWSGADFIQLHLPKEVKLQRLVLYKRKVPHGTFMYVLLSELKNGLAYTNSILDLIERLNERSCGYASLYVIDDLY